MSTFKLSAMSTSLVAAGLLFSSVASATGVTTNIPLTSAGLFSESYTFTVASGTTADFFGNLTSAYDFIFDFSGALPAITAASGANISSITFSGPSFNSGISLTSDDVDGDGSWIGYTQKATFSALGLSAGTYTLSVKGRAYSPTTIIGSYALDVSPVPEAETYSMFMLGMGLLSVIGLRRKSK